MSVSFTNTEKNQSKKYSPQPTNYGALSTLITVFFFWGFIAAGNSIFIPFCKNYFHLDQFQSQLIDFAFYLAYYIGALLLFTYGAFGGKDLVGKWGYKKSIVYGLLFSALGAVAMIIAVNANVFTGMLAGLFIVALGFSLQQTAAQPFAVLLGDPTTGASRVNLGGGINSFGTMIGPLVVAFALFGTTLAVEDEQIKNLGLDKVILLYACVGALFVAAAALFYFSKKVPSGISTEKNEPAQKAFYSLVIMTGLLIIMFVPVFNSYKINPALLSTAEKLDLESYRMKWLFGALAVVILGLLISNYRAQKSPSGWGAMKYPQLVLGMIALFLYVGTEVTIVSNLSELISKPAFGSHSTSEAALFVSMYWGSLMIGRWVGSISAFSFRPSTKKMLTFVVPLMAFLIVLGVNSLSGRTIDVLLYYVICVLVQIGAFYVSKEKPVRMLLVFGLLGVASMAVGLATTGIVAVYAFLSGGLFCSIMWPAIFTLSIAGLGKYTSQGSAFLIMMILGGGVIPPIQGKLADLLESKSSVAGTGIHESYWVPLFCFAYIVLFALLVKRILKKQGINYEQEIDEDVAPLAPESALLDEDPKN